MLNKRFHKFNGVIVLNMARKGVNVIHAKCDPELVKDKSLPYTAYLVEYENEGEVCYDIATGSKIVEIFDHYYDKYGSVLRMTQTEGRTNPKLWQDPNGKKK